MKIWHCIHNSEDLCEVCIANARNGLGVMLLLTDQARQLIGEGRKTA